MIARMRRHSHLLPVPLECVSPAPPQRAVCHEERYLLFSSLFTSLFLFKRTARRQRTLLGESERACGHRKEKGDDKRTRQEEMRREKRDERRGDEKRRQQELPYKQLDK